MTLFNNIRRVYPIKVKCTNCCKPCEVFIKKGVTVKEAVKEKSIKCDNCGCEIVPDEYQTQWAK